MSSSRKANTVGNDLSVHLLSADASRLGRVPGTETCVCNDDNTSLSTHSAPGPLSQLVLHHYDPPPTCPVTDSERSSHLSKVTQPMSGTSETGIQACLIPKHQAQTSSHGMGGGLIKSRVSGVVGAQTRQKKAEEGGSVR